MGAFAFGTGIGFAGVECVASSMAAVESRLAGIAASSFGPAGEVAAHLLNAGGKRIRPTLVLLSVGACGGEPEDGRAVDVAVASELVHMASLLHDDVVDETRSRRGVPTANDIWGNKLSVLAGDFILARALTLVAELSNTRVVEVLSATAVRMTESEILQVQSEGSVGDWRENYWRIIQGKTAALTSACCECGAILAGAGPDARRALSEFGSHFGVVFQITDDLLDILGNRTETGKDIGADLTHGKFTLPILLALEHASGNDAKSLASLCESGFLSADDARQAAHLVMAAGGDKKAREVALAYIDKACECLRPLPDSEYVTCLQQLVESLAGRHS